MKILDELQQAGLVQFGLFEDNKPFRLSLQLLPAYPSLLAQIADAICTKIDSKNYEHILCTADSVSLATLVSQALSIPLVYSQGRGQTPVHDLVGAYDVGHPTLLVCNVWGGLIDFINQAMRVGLDVSQVVCAIRVAEEIGAIDVTSLFTLEEIIKEVNLPDGQAKAVIRWLAQKQA